MGWDSVSSRPRTPGPVAGPESPHTRPWSPKGHQGRTCTRSLSSSSDPPSPVDTTRVGIVSVRSTHGLWRTSSVTRPSSKHACPGVPPIREWVLAPDGRSLSPSGPSGTSYLGPGRGGPGEGMDTRGATGAERRGFTVTGVGPSSGVRGRVTGPAGGPVSQGSVSTGHTHPRTRPCA